MIESGDYPNKRLSLGHVKILPVETCCGEWTPQACAAYRQAVTIWCDRHSGESSQETLLRSALDFLDVQGRRGPIPLDSKQLTWEVEELGRRFPANCQDPKRLKTLLEILLRQQIEQSWYRGFPRYRDGEELAGDPQLTCLTEISIPVKFQFTVLRERGRQRWLSRVRRQLRIWRNHPAGGTVGMKVTRCRPEMVRLLNQICDRSSSRYGNPVSLQVNSLIRTLNHQQHLASLGYWAPFNTTHATGYAADLEREWYLKNQPRLFQVINKVLDDYQQQGILNVIHEIRVWHICLNPGWRGRYDGE